ncbi:hypothetical protein F4810DRAFT_695519 [Camillea tinctor]|nr:hypothetical protein F4810DRAFT_695519 [Camillea tinctor]
MSSKENDVKPTVEHHEYILRSDSTLAIFDLPLESIIPKYLEKETNPKVVEYLKDFLKVNNWCENPAHCRSVFDVVTQGHAENPSEKQQSHNVLRGHQALRRSLETDIGSDIKTPCLRSFIAENICPYSICLFGIMFDIKPSFWATHFEKTYQTQQEDVDPWLQPLPSASGDRDLSSFNIQYLEPRELDQAPKSYESMDTIYMVPRPLKNFRNYSINESHERRYEPSVNRDVQIIPAREETNTQRDIKESQDPVAFIPGPLSVWTKTSAGTSDFNNGSDLMVILIDPAPENLEVKANYHLDKTPQGSNKLVRLQRPSQRVANNLLACNGRDEKNIITKSYYGIGAMITKQWQLVHGYMARDFHRIETKLHDIPDFTVAERMLKDLFRHRQNCVQYSKLLKETHEEFQEWKFDSSNPIMADINSISSSLEQLSCKIDRNVNLLTDLTAIKEAQQGLQENHGVTQLTQIATIYLPFSTVAAVLAMPNQFAPGASQFWVYWAASVVLAALVILVLVSYQPLTTTYDDIRRRKRERRHDYEKSRHEGMPHGGASVPSPPQAWLGEEEKGFVVQVEPVRQSRSF